MRVLEETAFEEPDRPGGDGFFCPSWLVPVDVAASLSLSNLVSLPCGVGIDDSDLRFLLRKATPPSPSASFSLKGGVETVEDAGLGVHIGLLVLPVRLGRVGFSIIAQIS